jgi:Flp pilus assembly protein TadD
VLHRIAMFFQSQGRYDVEAHYLQRAIAQERLVFGRTSKQVACTLLAIAKAACNQGNFGDATRNATKALALFQRGSELDSSNATKTPTPQSKRSISATSSATKAIANTANDAKVLECLVVMAMVHKKQGEYGKAEALYLQALKQAIVVYGIDHAEYAKLLNHAADVQRKTGALQPADTYVDTIIWRTVVPHTD